MEKKRNLIKKSLISLKTSIDSLLKKEKEIKKLSNLELVKIKGLSTSEIIKKELKSIKIAIISIPLLLIKKELESIKIAINSYIEYINLDQYLEQDWDLDYDLDWDLNKLELEYHVELNYPLKIMEKELDWISKKIEFINEFINSNSDYSLEIIKKELDWIDKEMLLVKQEIEELFEGANDYGQDSEWLDSEWLDSERLDSEQESKLEQESESEQSLLELRKKEKKVKKKSSRYLNLGKEGWVPSYPSLWELGLERDYEWDSDIKVKKKDKKEKEQKKGKKENYKKEKKKKNQKKKSKKIKSNQKSKNG